MTLFRGRNLRDFSLLAILTLLLAVAPLFANEYMVEVGYRILQLVALATAWNLLAGYTGMVSLGSAAFFGLGVYTVTELNNKSHIPLGINFLIGGLIAAVFAALVSVALFRLRGFYFTIGTLALSEALRLFMVNSPWFGGEAGIYLNGSAPSSDQFYWMALAIAVVATLVIMMILRKPLIFRLNAIRDDEDVASAMGVFTFRSKLWAFVISSAIMGIVGGIQALELGVVEPNGSFSISWTVSIVLVGIIGGTGTVVGPWVGAVFTMVLAEYLKNYPEVHLAITGLVLLLVIRFAPRGIWGSLLGFWKSRSLKKSEADNE